MPFGLKLLPEMWILEPCVTWLLLRTIWGRRPIWEDAGATVLFAAAVELNCDEFAVELAVVILNSWALTRLPVEYKDPTRVPAITSAVNMDRFIFIGHNRRYIG